MGGDNTNHKTFKLNEPQWEYLLACLQKEETVLFLGPGILPHTAHNTVEDALFQHLLETSEASGGFIEKFYRDDKFFKLKEKGIEENRFFFLSSYQKFFNKDNAQLDAAREVVSKIVQIPFSTIITLCPNQLLESAYGEDYASHSDFYKKKEKPRPYIPGTKEDPLIYYMRGNIADDASMVISHNDLFDYLESIYESKSMDDTFKSDLKQAKYFIFLGLPLEAWYMQLLMRLFEFHIKTPKILALKRFTEQHNGQKLVYEDLYEMEFHDHDGPEFIEQLYKICEERSLLKAPKSNTKQASFQRDALVFQERLKNGHIVQSLTELENLSKKYLQPASEYSEYLINLSTKSSSYKKALRDYTTGFLTKPDFSVEENKLIAYLHMQFDDLQELINE